MSENKPTCLKNDADPRGRELFLYEHIEGSKYTVEKPATGFCEECKTWAMAKGVYNEQLENSN